MQSFLERLFKFFYRFSWLRKIGQNSLNLFFPKEDIIVSIYGGIGKGLKMSLNLQYEKSYLFGIHEEPVQKCLKRFISIGSVVYDIGANIGFFSLIASKLTGIEGKVFAFEPVPESYIRLLKNIHLNKMKNIHPVQKAISCKSGVGQFVRGPTLSMGHLKVQSNSISEKFEVKKVTLDDFIFEQSHPVPNVIKMDIEGGEGEGIVGAQKTLKELSPVIICEIHDPANSQLVERELKKAGYVIYNLANQEIVNIPNYGYVLGIKNN